MSRVCCRLKARSLVSVRLTCPKSSICFLSFTTWLERSETFATSLTCWSSPCFLMANSATPRPMQATTRMMMAIFIFIRWSICPVPPCFASLLNRSILRRRIGFGVKHGLLHRLQIRIQNLDFFFSAQFLHVSGCEFLHLLGFQSVFTVGGNGLVDFRNFVREAVFF